MKNHRSSTVSYFLKWIDKLRTLILSAAICITKAVYALFFRSALKLISRAKPHHFNSAENDFKGQSTWNNEIALTRNYLKLWTKVEYFQYSLHTKVTQPYICNFKSLSSRLWLYRVMINNTIRKKNPFMVWTSKKWITEVTAK